MIYENPKVRLRPGEPLSVIELAAFFGLSFELEIDVATILLPLSFASFAG